MFLSFVHMNAHSEEKFLEVKLLDQDICTLKFLTDFDKTLYRLPIYTLTWSV